MNYIFALLFTLSAFASDSLVSAPTEVMCDMKRGEFEKMNFEFHFLSEKRGLSTFHFQKGEESGSRNIPVSAIHQSTEGRYVGLDFLGDEKLVFILLSPIFSPENLNVTFDIEVVSSLYGPTYLKCHAIK